MSISGITSTTERGARIVTTAQNLTSASALSESIVIDGAGTTAAIRASGTADITLERCNIFINATAPSTTGINQSWLSYNGDSGSRTVTTRFMRLVQTSLLVKSTARVDLFLSELRDCQVSEVDSTGNMNLYTQPGAVLVDTSFKGINSWEVVGTPAQAGGLSFEDVQAAFFNFQAGRLDFSRINVISTTVSSCFLANGAANNSVYNWDVVSFDREAIGRQVADNLYFEGITASLEFRDRDTGAAQADVLVIYRDDRASAGSFVQVGRYTTGANGRMVGTVDTRFNTAGASIERPTLFMLVWRLVDNPATGAFVSPAFGGASGRAYDLVPVQPRIEIRSYLHQPPSGYGAADNYTITSPQGAINGDFTVNTYANFNLVVDPGVTVTKATALAYTALATCDQLYDRAKAAWRDNDNFPLPTFNGSALDFGNRNIVVDASAPSAYAFNSGTNTITINASVLAPGTKFTSLTTTGTITVEPGASISAVYSDSSGTSTLLSLAGLTGATVAVYDNTGAQVNYEASVTGTYTLAIAPGATGTWRWVANRSGYIHSTATFTPGGAVNATPTLAQKLNADGSAMYAGASSALLAISFTPTVAYLDVGNGIVSLQAAFDESEDALLTEPGMAWLAAGNDSLSQFNSAGGDFLFMTGGWRLRRAAPGDVGATINAFVQSTDGVAADETNGVVRFLTSDSPTAVAAAVQALLAPNFASIKANTDLIPATL